MRGPGFLEGRIYKVVSQVMGVPVETVDDQASPDTIETWDSVRHMNLVLALEEEFNISFNDEQITELLTVGLIIEAIRLMCGDH